MDVLIYALQLVGKHASPKCRKFHPKLQSPDLFPEKYKSERIFNFRLKKNIYIYTHFLPHIEVFS